MKLIIYNYFLENVLDIIDKLEMLVRNPVFHPFYVLKKLQRSDIIKFYIGNKF
jgi:hypothetical protein